VIFVAATFVLMLAVVLGAYWMFVLRLEESDDAALRKRLRPDPVTAREKSFALLKPMERLSGVGQLNTLLEQMGRIAAPLHNLYGPTEAAVDVTHWTCRPGEERWGVPIDAKVRAKDIGTGTVASEHLATPAERLTIALTASSPTKATMDIAWADTHVRVPIEKR